MMFFIIVLTALVCLLIYSVVKYLRKRRQLGEVIFKANPGFAEWLVMGLSVIMAGAMIAYVVIMVRKHAQSAWYDWVDTTYIIMSFSVYLVLLIRGCISAVTSFEIREKGITLNGWAAEYADVRGVDWLNEKKVQINFDPGHSLFLNRQFKVKKTFKDEHIDEVKRFLSEKC